MSLAKDRHYKNRLLQAQQRRKQANNDLQLLTNRISLLKGEEQKTWKKIQQTKGRAFEITSLREESANRMSNRSADIDRANEKSRVVVENRLNAQEKIRQKRLKYAEEVQLKKRDEVQEMRREKHRLKLEAEAERKAAIERAAASRASVKEAQLALQRQREKEREELLRRNREAYEARIAQEDEETCAKELEVARMEKMEMELIQKLRNTQVLQKQAYEELEIALTGGNPPTPSPASSTQR